MPVPARAWRPNHCSSTALAATAPMISRVGALMLFMTGVAMHGLDAAHEHALLGAAGVLDESHGQVIAHAAGQ